MLGHHRLAMVVWSFAQRLMAGFQTHITVSTVTGIGYGVWGFHCGALLPTCVLAGGLCSVSGMLPDLDSDSGRPVQEMSCFAAAVVPLLMLERFKDFGWSHETMALAGAASYAAIRFGAAEIFKRYTVHRGMWHSLPACLACGLLAFIDRRRSRSGHSTVQGGRGFARVPDASGARRNLELSASQRQAEREEVVRHGAEALRPGPHRQSRR